MKKLAVLLTLSLSFIFADAQVYYSKNASVSFFSKTSMEDIKADNNQVLTVLNTKTGDVQFSLAVKGFHFSKPLMEEHFNENYMESEKYSKSTFKGQIEDINKINFSKDGTYKVVVKGDLTMHGVTKNISVPGNIVVEGGKISSNSKFIVTLSDFNIAIPKIVQQTIQKTIEITTACKYELKQ
jgi:hypothetical protein